MMQGWVFLADAIEKDGWITMAGITRTGKGYIAHEIDDLVKQAEHLWVPAVPTLVSGR